MNACNLRNRDLSTARIAQIVRDAGFEIERLAMRGGVIHFTYHRLNGSHAEEQRPSFTSYRGRENFTALHQKCKDLEREDRSAIKRLVRPELLDLEGVKMYGRDSGHLDKFVWVADGIVVHNTKAVRARI